MTLRECYERTRRLADNIDTLEVVEEVERYRAFWKPKNVRVVLLAESHVLTSHEDFAHHWSYGTDPACEGKFVRFVYCLANGEKDLVNIPSNKGTWQFWKILFSCLNRVSENREFAPLLRGSTRDFHQRMKNKIKLLRSLQERGIWLVDASVVGINKLTMSAKARVLRQCWHDYTRQMLGGLDPRPSHIIVIGAGVKKALQDELGELGISYNVIPQPQAHLEGGYARYHKEYYELCSKF